MLNFLIVMLEGIMCCTSYTVMYSSHIHPVKYYGGTVNDCWYKLRWVWKIVWDLLGWDQGLILRHVVGTSWCVTEMMRPAWDMLMWDCFWDISSVGWGLVLRYVKVGLMTVVGISWGRTEICFGTYLGGTGFGTFLGYRGLLLRYIRVGLMSVVGTSWGGGLKYSLRLVGVGLYLGHLRIGRGLFLRYVRVGLMTVIGIIWGRTALGHIWVGLVLGHF
jgi:hypothetical protein